MSSATEPVLGKAMRGPVAARNAATASASRLGHHRSIVVLAAPARAAPPSTVTPVRPPSSSSAYAASRTAIRASSPRGRPLGRRGGQAGAEMGMEKRYGPVLFPQAPLNRAAARHKSYDTLL